MNLNLIKDLVMKHEGRRAAVYTDTVGKLTIGVGWNLESAESQDICDHFGLDLEGLKHGCVTLTDAQIDEVFDYQLEEATAQGIKLFPGYDAMPDAVQAVVTDMIFNMGSPTFRQFNATIAALKAGNWKLAAVHAGQSRWAMQVPNRAKEDMALLNAA